MLTFYGFPEIFKLATKNHFDQLIKPSTIGYFFPILISHHRQTIKQRQQDRFSLIVNRITNLTPLNTCLLNTLAHYFLFKLQTK